MPFNVVNIADLLAVISQWGPCESPGALLPQSVYECAELADEACEESEDPECWEKTYGACLQSLCVREIIECD